MQCFQHTHSSTTLPRRVAIILDDKGFVKNRSKGTLNIKHGEIHDSYH